MHKLDSSGPEFWNFLGGLDLDSLLSPSLADDPPTPATNITQGVRPSCSTDISESVAENLAVGAGLLIRTATGLSCSSWTSEGASHDECSTPGVRRGCRGALSLGGRARTEEWHNQHGLSHGIDLNSPRSASAVRRPVTPKAARTPSRCQVDTCRALLANEKIYHRRRRLCRSCVHAESVATHGQMMRFCQQCSHLHNIEEFDGRKRSCREKLASHKMRRFQQRGSAD